MEPNLAESIYIRSSIKFLHFVPFRQQIWPLRVILVSDWLMLKKIFSSETAWPNGAKLGRKHLCKILYKTFSLVPFGQQMLLLKIEHMVKLYVLGNNSKTVNNIRNLTWVKMISTGRSNYPEILKKI